MNMTLIYLFDTLIIFSPKDNVIEIVDSDPEKARKEGNKDDTIQDKTPDKVDNTDMEDDTVTPQKDVQQQDTTDKTLDQNLYL
jgi:hypothetical protein